MSSSSRHICMVTTFYPPFHFGGDAVAVQRLARALARAGHRVTVVHDVDAYRALGGVPRAEPAEEDDVRVLRLESRCGALSPLLTQQLGRPVMHARTLRRLMSAEQFDVVHFHNVSLIGGPGALRLGGEAVRLYTAHEHWLVCQTHVLWRHDRELCTARQCIRCALHHGRPPQLWRHVGTMERALRHVDTFIAMSEFSRAKHREFGFPYEMEVLPAFLPDEDPSAATTPAPSPHARPYFLYVGRLELIKGLDDVIPLFSDYADADLLVAGDGGHAGELRALTGGNPHVTFLGQIPADQLRGYYQHAIAVIVPSRCFETFGLTLIEAFQQGAPVIARDIGPFPEIVRQARAGLLFSTREELGAAMRRLQREPGLRTALSRAGREAFAARWTERVAVQRYLEVVDGAFDRRTASRQTRTAAAGRNA